MGEKETILLVARDIYLANGDRLTTKHSDQAEILKSISDGFGGLDMVARSYVRIGQIAPGGLEPPQPED